MLLFISGSRWKTKSPGTRWTCWPLMHFSFIRVKWVLVSYASMHQWGLTSYLHKIISFLCHLLKFSGNQNPLKIRPKRKWRPCILPPPKKSISNCVSFFSGNRNIIFPEWWLILISPFCSDSSLLYVSNTGSRTKLLGVMGCITYIYIFIYISKLSFSLCGWVG